MTVRILEGDCREVLRGLPDESVQCVVTSPPYFALRSYGIGAEGGEIGAEKTPDQYVANMVNVFREVRRVLRNDGTCWINLGDSYASNPASGGESTRTNTGGQHHRTPRGEYTRPPGLKPKDLIGIPWRVAFALQAPYYTGRIRDERDRIWLAAMLDAEGCVFIHKRKAGQNNGQGYQRQNDTYSPGIEISNTHEAIVRRCMEIAGIGSICTQTEGRRQTLFRWNVRTTESRELVRELYPYLVAKQHQARIMCGCPTSGERAEAAHAALMLLHRGATTDVDFPAPRPMYEPGFYLRSEIIWSKSNPMPESVTDRPTKAHEYLFLLSKSERYYYDAAAIAEEAEGKPQRRLTNPLDHPKGNPHGSQRNGLPRGGGLETTRNRRSVWTIPTTPFPGAHFATFPPKLIEPCVLAGTSEAGCCAECRAPLIRETSRGDAVAPTFDPLAITQSGALPDGGVGTHRNMGGRYQAWLDANPKRTIGWRKTCGCDAGVLPCTVLDPFGGAGTTALVADRLGRHATLIELNPEYAKLARERITNDAGLFTDVA